MLNELGLTEVSFLKDNREARASGLISREADFFKDHFPDFPILPGVLGLEILKQTAVEYCRTGSGKTDEFQVCRLRNVRFAHFFRPGDSWRSVVKMIRDEDAVTEWKGQLFREDHVCALSAKFCLTRLLK